MTQVETEIRRAVDMADYEACIELQTKVWHNAPLAAVAPIPILVAANRLGGCVLVARELSGSFAGFSFAIFAKSDAGKPIWWSYITAVTSQYRNRDVGLRLKLRQREEALREGIDEIHWSFDPLHAPSGYLNVHRLGAIVQRYEESSHAPANSGQPRLPGDRFVAEWKLNSEAVRERIESPGLMLRDLDGIPRVNPRGGEPRLDCRDAHLLIAIPTNLPDLDPAQIQDCEEDLRLICRHYFGSGYIVNDFIRLDDSQTEAFYLLSRTAAP